MDNPSRLERLRVAKAHLTFILQVFVLFIIVGVSLYNLSTGAPHTELWVSLLSSSVAVMLPNPKPGSVRELLEQDFVDNGTENTES